MRRIATLAVTSCAVGALLGAAPVRAAEPGLATGSTNADKPNIDVVFAIDCSGSMGPVIETAKKKVWTIVNQIAKAEPAPTLRIGLIGYGDADKTYREFPLSDDLDTVYKNLMNFKDEGWGDEFVGLAVHKAVHEMHWDDNHMALKVIYVLGNETARQGPAEFDYTKTAADAWRHLVFVNAIYCNPNQGRSLPTVQRNSLNRPNGATPQLRQNRSAPANQNSAAQRAATATMLRRPAGANVQQTPPVGQVIAAPNAAQTVPVAQTAPAPVVGPDAESLTWMEMAQVGHGQFLEIALDGNAVMLATPYDAELVKLNTSLNATYVPFGSNGRAGAVNQALQDTNAVQVGGAATLASRANAKSAYQYNNRGWDLVDAIKEKDFDWTKLKDEELPAAMRPMNLAQRKEYVATHAAQRAAIQKQIQQLGDKRDAYVKAEIKKQGLRTDNAFDEAVRRSLTQQAASKGYRFKE